jgi:hypothetical protein
MMRSHQDWSMFVLARNGHFSYDETKKETRDRTTKNQATTTTKGAVTELLRLSPLAAMYITKTTLIKIPMKLMTPPIKIGSL